MIKVMIVDDEPYIRQGLKILINWEQLGFQICEEAANGNEAIKKLEKKDIDLVITDIKMPGMDGLELIEYTREHISKKIRFIILSGFYEFEYAKKAIKFNVDDYVLKPVQKEELIKVLEEYKDSYYRHLENLKMQELSDRIIFDRHLINLISGTYDRECIEYVKNRLIAINNIRYIRIEYDVTNEEYDRLSDNDKEKEQNKLYEATKAHLGEFMYHTYMAHDNNNEFYVGFIYAKSMADKLQLSEKEYIKNLHDNLSAAISYRIIFYIGQKEESIETISESYKSALIAKNFQLYSKVTEISFYDEIKDKINTSSFSADKDLIDELIKAIEENDNDKIEKKVNNLYMHFKELVAEPEIIRLSMDYLMFSLIGIAKELYSDFDQDEVYKLISQGGYGQTAIRGSVAHFKKFALEFSDYLNSLRKHALGGVITEVEREITENYMNNLSLKSLSEKYFINSAYLGQIFKKQFGVSFKDYLNNYRIDRACELLLRTDGKIYEIAETVGFNNTDYFISKFVQIKGTTPLQYRKRFLTNSQNKN
ncbi:MAG: response regulator [Clostridiales bacterium]|nr:response regulator [Clostridiales bacterium]